MNDLMQKGWHFEFYANQLDTITCAARKGEVVKKKPITVELLEDRPQGKFYRLIDAIVAKVRDYEENKSLFGGANE